MASMRALVVTGVVGVSAADYVCPGSGSWVHAWMEVTATAGASCDQVKEEIVARASKDGGWTDPHNGGIYSVLNADSMTIQTQRTTNPKTSVGGQVYTDKQTFVLSDQGGSCQIKTCSESQGFSIGDFSTNYCDIRNLYCGSGDGCTTVKHDFTSKEDSHDKSIGASHDFSKCIVKPHALTAAVSDSYNCPGSGAWVHASMEVTAVAQASCANVKEEIVKRASAENGWKDPHNNGIYSVLDSSTNVVKTQRTTNPKTSVGGKVYTDKQNFELSDNADGSCEIKACSESQGTSIKDFSTNYCDIRNLYCGSADGCTHVSHDFASKEQENHPSLGAGSDFGVCIVKEQHGLITV